MEGDAAASAADMFATSPALSIAPCGELIGWTPYWYENTANQYGDPNGGTGENCLLVDLSVGYSAGKWADQSCDDTGRRYICERP
jgi:hypothetical protein